MVVEHDQQQSIRRKLSARISAAFRIQRQPSQFMLERQRIANDNNNNNNANNNDLTPRDLLRRQRRAASMAAAAASAAERAGRTPPRRSLPRGWWPDQGKREGLKLKAMDDLKNETFVITADHMEYVFQEGENEDESTSHYEINLILPPEITLRNDKQINRCSNECSICMLEYDAGDVVVCSKHCSHVFHQECILNWFSHSNIKSGESNRNCPSCRCNFWDFDEEKEKVDRGGSLRGNRSRSDTDDTAALSVSNADYSRGRGDSIDNENALSPVAEDSIVGV